MRVLLDPSEQTMESLRATWDSLMKAGFDKATHLMVRTIRDCLWEVLENATVATYNETYSNEDYNEEITSIVMSDWGETPDMIEDLQFEIDHLVEMETDLGRRILDRSEYYDWESELLDMFVEVIISFLPFIDTILPAATDICATMERIGIDANRLEMLQFDRTGRYLVAELAD